MEAEIGIIGGSGIYELGIIKDAKSIEVTTPFGKPSDKIFLGYIGDRRVAFLPRHGVGHRILPSKINNRANIYALKKLGVKAIFSPSAVGSMREEIKPRDFVIPDQLYDRTRFRISTFFSKDIVAHVGMAEPFCPRLSKIVAEYIKKMGYRVHGSGMYICIEGPQFSTRAESNIYRQWGADIIGMTAAPEAKLAREAEICFVVLATVTDYDVWHKSEREVDVKTIMLNLKKNEEKTANILKGVIPTIPRKRNCICKDGLKDAILTKKENVPKETLERLDLLVKKYFG